MDPAAVYTAAGVSVPPRLATHPATVRNAEGVSHGTGTFLSGAEAGNVPSKAPQRSVPPGHCPVIG